MFLKSSGKAKVYHLYRCSNSRKIHDKNVYISEEKIWKQFEPAIEKLEITEDFARDILQTMDETFSKQQAAVKKQMEGYRLALKELESREDMSREKKLKYLKGMDQTKMAQADNSCTRLKTEYNGKIDAMTIL